MRPDLIEAVKTSCCVIEAARGRLLSEWGGEFEDDAHNVIRRAEILATASSIHIDAEVIDGHLEWMRDVIGRDPFEVPMGAALVARVAEWLDAFSATWLGQHLDEFKALGTMEIRLPVPPTPPGPHDLILDVSPTNPTPCFVLVADTHIGARGTEEKLAAAIKDINELHPEFVLVAGDVTDDGEPVQFARAHELLSTLHAPVWCVLGNHDAVRRATLQPEGHELFASTFGYHAVDRVLEFNNLQVALIDTTDPVASPVPDWDLANSRFRKHAGGTNGGALRAGQAATLADRLDPTRPSLIVGHHELQPFVSFPPVMFALRQSDSDALLDALKAHNIVGYVAGHTHRSSVIKRQTFTEVEVPSTKDWPYCFAVCSVDNDELLIETRQVSDRDLVEKFGAITTQLARRYTLGATSKLKTRLPL